MTQTRALPLRRCQSGGGDSCVNRGSQTSSRTRTHEPSGRVREGFLEKVISWRRRALNVEKLVRVRTAAVGLGVER